MPHLQFEFNFELKKKEKKVFAKSIMDKFSEIMDTGTGHIAVTIREYKTGNLQLGRVEDMGERVAFVNADIREGRTYEKRRTLAIAFMDEIKRHFNVPEDHMYVIVTEHKGEDFHLYERALKNWTPQEDPLKD
jgi:phenylpyruvate tautomerase PptA (4-oxalocrotonate tautomerase family)